ncbi:MAG: response regulator [Elusimicrobia bacterium]|nr:response regulator [Elusimicrobiota bacterium]
MTESDRKTVLVVDDSALNRKILQDALEKKGYSVRVSENGEVGLRQVIEKTPDFILLDVMMPEMNGWDTCMRIRRAALTKQVPIIIMTSKDTAHDVLQAFEAGADEFIPKPINLEELFGMIERLLSSDKYSGTSTSAGAPAESPVKEP